MGPAGRPGRGAAAALGVMVALVVLLCGCASDEPIAEAPTTTARPVPQRATDVLVADAAFPVALLAEPDGSLLYAERLTGRVRRVDPTGALDPAPVAEVSVSGRADDQRGLLGLARDGSGRLVAAWTRPDDGRLVVGRVAGAESPELVWEGPVSADLANGGHLALAADGRLLIGVGDLLADRGLDTDPDVPNRKLLALDADGSPDQRPTVLSTGWNNPFAFTVDDQGIVWVADNTGADGPERAGRGDRPAAEATGMGGPGEGEVVPAALVALGPDRLGLCGFLSGRVDELVVTGDRVAPSGAVVADGCQTGLARLADGRLALATPDAIRVTRS